MPFDLNEADVTSDAILLTPAPWVVRFAVETPAGDVITPGVASGAVGAEFHAGTNVAFYRLTLPVVTGPGAAGAGPGQWTAMITIDEKYWNRYLSSLKEDQAGTSTAIHGLRYALTVHAYSSLRLRATLAQDSYEPGAAMTLRTVLTEHGIPLETGVKVEVELTRPDKTITTIGLPETEPGVFETTVHAVLAGVYGMHVKARGRTFRGLPFTREQELTGAVWRGGDDPPPCGRDRPNEDRARLCRLLACLLSRQTVSPELEKRLAEIGLNLAAVRRCLREFCRRPSPTLSLEALEPSERLRDLVAELDPNVLELLERIAEKKERCC